MDNVLPFRDRRQSPPPPPRRAHIDDILAVLAPPRGGHLRAAQAVTHEAGTPITWRESDHPKLGMTHYGDLPSGPAQVYVKTARTRAHVYHRAPGTGGASGSHKRVGPTHPSVDAAKRWVEDNIHNIPVMHPHDLWA